MISQATGHSRFHENVLAVCADYAYHPTRMAEVEIL